MKTTTTWQELLHPGDATDFFSYRTLQPFDPTVKDYSTTNALWLAELSRLVYRHDIEEDDPPPKPTRTSFLANVGLRQRSFFLSREANTQAMLVEPLQPPEFAVLVFRGTEQTINDFITDLNVGSLHLDDGHIAVHLGFRKALDSVWKEIGAELAKLTCPVFYTGHSLGAALATLAAARRRPHAVYTFGSPRVGNQLFANSLADVSIYRVVDDKDIVTTVPLEIMGFCHIGSEHRLTAPPGNLSIQNILNPPKPLADHAPINYVDRL